MTDTQGPRQGPAFSCDESLAPVVVVQWPASWVDDDHLRDGLRQMVTCQQRQRIAWVIDVRGAGRPDSEQRSAIATAMRDGHRDHPDHVAAVAVVSTSSLTRGVFLALAYLAPQRWPLEIFPERAPAIEWARAQLTGRGR